MLNIVFWEFPFLLKSPLEKGGKNKLEITSLGEGQASATISPPSVGEKRQLCILRHIQFP